MLSANNHRTDFSTDKLAKALFIINRHAKTAINPKYLYQLKHATITKMLKEGKAEKVGLHFSRNPKFSKQQLDVLILCGDYYFHIPPTKEDIQTLTNLGQLDDQIRNPKTVFPLKAAKRLLQQYTGLTNPEDARPVSHHQHTQHQRPRYTKPVFKRLGE